MIVGVLRTSVFVIFALCSFSGAHAQTPAPSPAPLPAPLSDANKNGLVGMYAIKEICSEKNPSKKPQIENNFANQLTRASPDLKAWAATPEFKTRLAARKAEQRRQMKQIVGATLIEGFCEDLTQPRT
jgi:hypothetical protein